MRKQIYLAALAAVGVLMSSCVHEKDLVTYVPEPEAVSFVLNGVSTRTDADTPIQVNRYNLGGDDSGLVFSLEETVSWMGDLGAESATRGTPVFTENVQDVYGSSFTGRAYNKRTGNLVAEDGEFFVMGDGKTWRRAFGFDPWPESDDLTFFFRMPNSATGISNLAYSTTAETIAFDYKTPATAGAQQDILFSKVTLDKEDYMTTYKTNGGYPILFRHALTGVKFALNPVRNNTTSDNRNPDGVVETFITKVEFTGLASKGHAVYTQDDSKESGADDTDEHSSKSSFVWSNLSDSDVVVSQEYSEDDIQDFDKDDADDKVHGPDTFYESGADRNLNKADASLTFWFIPQDITADLKLTVTFYVWNGQSEGEEVTLELNLGERILAQTSTFNKKWEAGQLRTFTLDPTVVDVSIEDEMSDDRSTKSDVQIRNTGNKDAYIRAAIVGNWVDPTDGTILMGSVADDGTYTPAVAWSETDTNQGVFVDLPTNSNWVKKDDGFWYFKQIVPPGKLTGETATGGTHIPLFTSYTKKNPPVEGAGLVMELVVQAVDASAGTNWESAWASVL